MTSPADPEAVIGAMQQASPFLASLEAAHAGFVNRALAANPAQQLEAIIAEAASAEFSESRADALRSLRQAKQKLALLAATYDIAQVWPLAEVTRALTRFADAAVQAALGFAWRQERAKGVFDEAPDTETGRGYLVLAMGKMGAGELNYSSDIDLIVLYDPARARLRDGEEPATVFVRLTRALVALLQDLTADGYVFRVDLRLRPDPRATQVAINFDAAMVYYETQGQNWERAAMIKARPCAGDAVLGAEFLSRIKPYIWRKYLDFAAIADIQSMKRQIHAVKGHGEIAVLGHDLKLGRGGIREIEFFAQTQQLIAGGRNPALRCMATLDALDALAAAGWITAQTAGEMKEAYGLLRLLEHRAQMIDDQQTHETPADPLRFETYARFAGFASGAELAARLEATLRKVQTHYAELFEQAGDLASDQGSLVFTGGEDDPATLGTLRRMGYRQVSEVSAIIRAWHFGRYRAMRTARARELLTELMPALLKALTEGGEADQALFAFDRFLESLGSGVQLLSMLKANPRILSLVAQILGAAPRLAEKISAQPRILEAVTTADFFSALPPRESLVAECVGLLSATSTLEEAMDGARIFAREKNFRVMARMLSQTLNADETGQGFSDVADATIAGLLEAVLVDIRMRHGVLPEGACAVIGMGKLGGCEMTAGSDLDVMLVYNAAAEAGESSGPRPLSPAQYYTKVTQGLVTALSAPTAEGRLYDVDMRLRPSGSKGPLATGFESFETYHRNEAWTWEHMALTRARVIAGDAALADRITAALRHRLGAVRDPAKTWAEIRAMRALMLKEHKAQGVWDLKRKSGGQIDIEFLAQGLQLVHAHAHPAILRTNTAEALHACAGAGILPKAEAEILLSALGLYQRLTHVLRLCIEGTFDPAAASPHLLRLITNAAGQPDLSATEALLEETGERVARVFEDLTGCPPG